LRLETLKTRPDFARVKDGSKWAAKSFVMQAIVRGGADGQEPARFGFTVSGRSLAEKGKDGVMRRAGAVTRNRARRRLKEAVRLLAAGHARPGYDYVIIGRREALHQRFADLLEDVALAFAKVHRPPRARDRQPRPKTGRTNV
jgi:ribonuclease P protein component